MNWLGRYRRFLTIRHLADALLLLGLVGIAVACVLAMMEFGAGRTRHAEGVIVGLSDPPVVQFVPTPGSESVTFTYDTRTTFWNAGDHVNVAFSPDDPRNARIDGLTGRWFMPTAFGSAGILALVAGAILTLTGRVVVRRRRPAWPLR